jgi:bacterioferritin (cytochrome b1)
MVNRGLSNEEKIKFSNYFRTWFKSQNKFKLIEISKVVNIPKSSLYDYIYYNKAPHNIEKANAIINFIKNNQQSETKLSNSSKKHATDKTHIEKIKDDAVILCQLSELLEVSKKLQSAIETFQNRSNPLKRDDEKKGSNEINSHIDNLERSLLSLHSELIWFKNATSEERKVLRKSLKSKDVGYITSLLRAIMKGEEEINDWIAATTYQLEMIKWKKQH